MTNNERSELEDRIRRLICQTRLRMPDIVRAFDHYPEREVRSTVIGMVDGGPLELDGERYIAIRRQGG